MTLPQGIKRTSFNLVHKHLTSKIPSQHLTVLVSRSTQFKIQINNVRLPRLLIVFFITSLLFFILVIQNTRSSADIEFTDVCQYHLGKPGYILAISFSMLALFGAIIVYYVLMCNFLYYTGDFIYSKLTVVFLFQLLYSIQVIFL